jgi:hypothetical protein
MNETFIAGRPRSTGTDAGFAIFARAVLFFFGVDQTVAGKYPRREVAAIAQVMASLSDTSRDILAEGLLREYVSAMGAGCGFAVNGSCPSLEMLPAIKREALAHFRRLMTVN